ncbi:MAG: hypothetical protein MI924_23615 [Chloroflexales bacterium]|nr:hypothetical protein [Chloroflexales bacterium]
MIAVWVLLVAAAGAEVVVAYLCSSEQRMLEGGPPAHDAAAAISAYGGAIAPTHLDQRAAAHAVLPREHAL